MAFRYQEKSAGLETDADELQRPLSFYTVKQVSQMTHRWSRMLFKSELEKSLVATCTDLS